MNDEQVTEDLEQLFNVIKKDYNKTIKARQHENEEKIKLLQIENSELKEQVKTAATKFENLKQVPNIQ